jgi:hypothetical protein
MKTENFPFEDDNIKIEEPIRLGDGYYVNNKKLLPNYAVLYCINLIFYLLSVLVVYSFINTIVFIGIILMGFALLKINRPIGNWLNKKTIF